LREFGNAEAQFPSDAEDVCFSVPKKMARAKHDFLHA
jgi:hypothetical protein